MKENAIYLLPKDGIFFSSVNYWLLCVALRWGKLGWETQVREREYDSLDNKGRKCHLLLTKDGIFFPFC
jgi:hypothetical protein